MDQNLTTELVRLTAALPTHGGPGMFNACDTCRSTIVGKPTATNFPVYSGVAVDCGQAAKLIDSVDPYVIGTLSLESHGAFKRKNQLRQNMDMNPFTQVERREYRYAKENIGPAF